MQVYAVGETVNVTLNDGRVIPAEVRRTFDGPSAALIEVRFGTVVGQRRLEMVPRRIVSKA